MVLKVFGNISVTFSKSFVLENVLYLPNFAFDLVSITKSTSSLNCFLTFIEPSCDILESHTLRKIRSARVQDGLYVLQSLIDHNKPVTIVNSVTNYIPNVWHNRLGHLSHEKLSIMHRLYPYVPLPKCNKDCEICPLVKQRKAPFFVSHKSNATFDLLHVDICGPNLVLSAHGHRCYITIVDDYTRHTWICFMKNKSKTTTCILNLINMVETQFFCKVKSVRSDNGLGFALLSFYLSKGIMHQMSCVETPQQNGVVERKHQHIMNTARALLFQSNLPKVL